ncbi:hypothetical protein [Halorhabdus amylolytica]|uniref:hypothetical protein n=1 Tax=Halorhabdus amylolytica TaxID=2559573 RepID=UPI0010AA8B43|nr:hypothetical protein [Halorhabdus amylolytica]
MNQQVEQGYRIHRVLSNLHQFDVDRLDDVDRERIETARDLLKEVRSLTLNIRNFVDRAFMI